MRMLDLRADASNRDRATARVDEFFAELADGHWETAAVLCVDPVIILGRVVTRLQLGLGQGKAFGRVLDSRVVPKEVLERFEDETAEEMFGLALQPTDAVLFATVPLDGEGGTSPATYGVIVDMQKPTEPLVKSLFDPSRFKTFSEWLASEVDAED